MSCQTARCGPAQAEQDCALLANVLFVPGPLPSAREAEGNVGISWEECLSDQKCFAVRLMLKKLKCEIVIDENLKA